MATGETVQPAGLQGFAFIDEYLKKNKPDEAKLVGVCLEAIEEYKKGEHIGDKNAVELLGTFIAEGAKDPKQKATAERIARALSKTELFRNASHTVRGNIESALTGWSWLKAKLKEGWLIPNNLRKYGVDETKKQDTLIEASLKLISDSHGDLERVKSLKEAFIASVTNAENRIFDSREKAEKFFDGFVKELSDLQYMSSFSVRGEGSVVLPQPADIPAPVEKTSEELIEEDVVRQVTIKDPVQAPEVSQELGDAAQKLLSALGIASETRAEEFKVERRYQQQALQAGREIEPRREKGLYNRISSKQPVSVDEISREMGEWGNTSVKYLMRYAIVALKHGKGNFEASKCVLEAYKRLVIDPLGQMPDGENAKTFARKELILFLDEIQAPTETVTKQQLAELYTTIGAEVPERLK